MSLCFLAQGRQIAAPPNQPQPLLQSSRVEVLLLSYSSGGVFPASAACEAVAAGGRAQIASPAKLQS